MTNIPGANDLVWDRLVGFAAADIPQIEITDADIKIVAANFSTNVRRTYWMIMMPSIIGSLTSDMQRAFDLAEYSLTQKLETNILNSTQHARFKEIQHLGAQIWKVDNQEKLQAAATRGARRFFIEALSHGTLAARMISEPNAPARAGLESILYSAMSGLWTAFETMSGDLWETALNTHPRGLSELKGKWRRLLTNEQIKDAEDSNNDTNHESDSESQKSFPLRHVIRWQYDLRKRMGTALRGGQHFDSLLGIRAAYGLAFFKDSSELDAQLRDKSLDTLNALRNVIVHRSAVADETYVKQTKFLPDLPKAVEGAKIILNGNNVPDLLTKIIPRALNLLIAVDKRVAKN